MWKNAAVRKKISEIKLGAGAKQKPKLEGQRACLGRENDIELNVKVDLDLVDSIEPLVRGSRESSSLRKCRSESSS
jgi:hypothetical protein